MDIITYIALGSNQNNPANQLNIAVQALKALSSSGKCRVSSFYQSPFHEPAPGTVQEDCVNAVAELHTSLSAEALLEALQHIENKQGRVRSAIRNTARTLDLDIILYGNKMIELPTLTIPHPRLSERHFVLVPLYELAPELILPNGKSLKHYVETINTSSLEKMVLEGMP